MRSKRDLLIFSALIVSVLLFASVSAFWPFTGNAVDSGARPTITSTSPSDNVIHIGANQLMSFSFSASDPDSDLSNMWMQVWRQQSVSNLNDFVSISSYNNPSGFLSGNAGSSAATSSIFTLSLPAAGTYYLRFAVRDAASPSLTEAWKTIIVGEKGSVCGADNQCASGLRCSSGICNDPSSSEQIAGLCQACGAAKACTTGMFCDSGVCKYNAGALGEPCVKVSRATDSSNLCVGTYSKPCASGLTCKYSEFWATEIGFDEGVCQNTSVGLGQPCDINNICMSGLTCAQNVNVCVSVDAASPVVSDFRINASSAVQGDLVHVYAKAVKGTAALKQHRLYVEGSSSGQGSQWTSLAASSSEAVVDAPIATLTNSKSFYRGPGEYTLVYEAEDTSGKKASASLPITLAAPANAALPRIPTFSLSSPQVVQGGQLGVIVVAMKGSAPLYNHRLYVEGSNNGAGSAWTRIEASSSEQSVLNSSIPTFTNPKSFYRGPGVYVLRYEINDSSGQIASLVREVRIAPQGNASGVQNAGYPVIGHLELNALQLRQGENLYVSASATAANGTALKRHRLYVRGSNNGLGSAWTNLPDGALTAAINPSIAISTLNNSRSFYHGAGEYKISYEVENSRGQVTGSEKTLTLLEPASGDALSNSSQTFSLSSVSAAPSTVSALSDSTIQANFQSAAASGSPNSTASSSIACSDGCLSVIGSVERCYPAGQRRGSWYCDIDAKQMAAQKASGSACSNNFECSSNICAANECIDANLMQRVLNWFRGLSGEQAAR